MSDPDSIDNPVATDVHVAAPGRLDAVRRRQRIAPTAFRLFPGLGRLRGGLARLTRTIARALRRPPALVSSTDRQGPRVV